MLPTYSGAGLWHTAIKVGLYVKGKINMMVTLHKFLG